MRVVRGERCGDVGDVELDVRERLWLGDCGEGVRKGLRELEVELGREQRLHLVGHVHERGDAVLD